MRAVVAVRAAVPGQKMESAVRCKEKTTRRTASKKTKVYVHIYVATLIYQRQHESRFLATKMI